MIAAGNEEDIKSDAGLMALYGSIIFAGLLASTDEALTKEELKLAARASLRYAAVIIDEATKLTKES